MSPTTQFLIGAVLVGLFLAGLVKLTRKPKNPSTRPPNNGTRPGIDPGENQER